MKEQFKILNICKLFRKTKVEVELMGGLGNQLFMYFAGLHLAEKCNAVLEFNMDKIRETNLTHPSRDISFLRLDGVFLEPRSYSKISQFLSRASHAATRRIGLLNHLRSIFEAGYKSSELGFDPKFDEIGSPRKIQGYFQTWKYAAKHKPYLSHKMDAYNPSSKAGAALIRESSLILPIIVHIRLGDYKHPSNSKFGILGDDYYRNALGILYSDPKFKQKQIWVFSDEVAEAKNRYSKIFPERTFWFGSSDNLDNLDVLVAMRNGSAHVIANSSFSWWAAFSSETTNLVIVPRKWFQNMSDPRDLYPTEWKQIETFWSTINE